MKVHVRRVVTDEVNLSKDQVEEIVEKYLKRLITPGEYLRKEGKKVILKQDDPHWRRGSVSEVTVREATTLDLAVFEVLNAIRNKADWP